MGSQILQPRGEAPFDLYPYTPAAAPGWAFLVLFAIAGVTHFVMMIPLRSWYFVPFILGCAGEAGGYYGRAWSHENIRNGSPYLIQLMLILASAPLLSATIYMTLGRFIRGLEAEDKAVIRPSWTTKIYVIIDIGSFVCQMAGSAMQSSGDAAGAKLGNNIVIGGLAFQLAAFVGFVTMTMVVHVRLNRDPTVISRRPQIKWRRNMYNLYAVSLMVFVRSAFRLVEFTEGPDGTIHKREIFLYVFDAALMFGVTVAMAALHPGFLLRTIRKDKSNALVSDGNDSYLLQGQSFKQID